MNIRLMTKQDMAAVWEIEQLAHPIPWAKGTLVNCQGERYYNLVLEKNEQIQGFAICQKVLDEATLFNIAIAPQYQGQGLGKALLQHLLQDLEAQNMHTLWLEVRESNRVAKALYEQMGFVLQGVRKNYYPTLDGKRENAWVMGMSF